MDLTRFDLDFGPTPEAPDGLVDPGPGRTIKAEVTLTPIFGKDGKPSKIELKILLSPLNRQDVMRGMMFLHAHEQDILRACGLSDPTEI